MTKKQIIIVGSGLAGLFSAYFLKIGDPSLDILIIGDSKSLSNCSSLSTSTISRSGIEFGVSKLGDILSRAFDFTFSFYNDFDLEFFQKGSKYHFITNDADEQKLKNRFNKLYEYQFLKSNLKGIVEDVIVFDANQFIQSLKDLVVKIGVNFQEGIVTQMDFTKNSIITMGSESYNYEKLILCTGAYTSLFAICDDKLGPSVGKTAVGHYLSWSVDAGNESFVLSHDGHNLSYSSLTKTFYFGGSTENDGVLALRKKWLVDYLDKYFSSIIKMPGMSDISFFTGIRQKGPKRMPTLTEVEKNVFYNGNYYKNGYVLAPYLGSMLANHIIGKHQLNI